MKPEPTASACKSPAIAQPVACKLARAAVVAPLVGPDQTTALVSVGRPGGDLGKETDEVWDVRSGKVVATLERDLDRVGELAAAWSADGERVAIAGTGDSKFGVGMFDTSTWKPVLRNKDVVWSFPCDLAADPSGKRVAMTTLIGEGWIDDFEKGKTLASLRIDPMRAAGHICMPLEWGGDGQLLVLEGLRTAKDLHEVKRPPGVPAAVIDVRPAPAGDLVAWLDHAGKLHVFEKHGTKKLQVIAVAPDLAEDPSAPNGPVRGFSFRRDGAGLVTWDEKGRVRVWDAKTGEKVKELRGTGDPLHQYSSPEDERARLLWSPDGRSFLFFGGAGPELWNVEEGVQKLQKKETAAKGEDASFPSHAVFSPDGALLAVGDAVWDARTGAHVRAVPAFRQWIDGSKFLLLQDARDREDGMRVLRVSDGAILRMDRLGDDANPVLFASTEDGVFHGPAEMAGCALPPAPEPAAVRRVAPEPRPTLLADFWSGRPVRRTCP